MSENLKEKYNELYRKHLVEGKDAKIMAIWGVHEKKLVEELIENSPEFAGRYINRLESCIESIGWNNYLSRREAETIMSAMVPKSKWSVDEVETACRQLGIPCEEKPFFNLCSLAVTMNMEMSNHGSTLEKHFCESTDLVKFVYQWSVECLKDKDRVEFIRPYFSL